MPIYNAICFDLFHTLVNIGNVPNEIGRHTADILGVSREQWSSTVFSPLHEIRQPTDALSVVRTLAHSINSKIHEEIIQQAVVERQARFDYALANIDPQVLATLEELKVRGYPLALISNASTAEVAYWGKSPLAKYFQVAIFSCACGFAKPEVEIYKLAATKLQVSTRNCLFVGDGGSDEHRGATQAGMTPVMITHYLEDSGAELIRARRHHVCYEISTMPMLLTIL